MDTRTMKTHPLVVIAATAVILTCLIAIGVMTGIVPSPLAKERIDAVETAPARRAANVSERFASPDSTLSSRVPTAPRPPESGVGSTRSTVPGRTVASTMPSACGNCGTVTSVRTVTRQGEAGIVGPLAGGAIGGAIGSQIGGGSGKTLATIAGAAAGAGIGTEVERRSKATTHYVVSVRLNDGTTRSFTYGAAPGVREGDRVKVVDGRLVRDS